MSRRYDLSGAVQEHWGRFLHEQSPERFLALRCAVVASPGYDPSPGAMDEADALLERGEVEEARGKLRAMMPGCLLSPRAHKMASYAFHKLGHLRSAAIELRMGMAVRQGILWTGDGTEACPYLVLHASDEQDVLGHLDKLPREHGGVERSGRRLQAWSCVDGSSIWFDVTVPHSHRTIP